MSAKAAGGAGKPKQRDHRTDGWRKKWKARQAAADKGGGADPKRAAAAVKALRRAAKKGKAFEIRKAARKLAQERDRAAAAGEGGGKEASRISKLEDLVERLKSLDLDSFTSAAAAAIPEMSDAMHSKLFSKYHPAPPLPQGGEALLRAEAVKKELRSIAAALDPRIKQAVEASKRASSKPQSGDESSHGELDSEDGGSDSDGAAARRRVGFGSEDEGSDMGGYDDESEPEDVSELIGDKVQKNRPGQRTRRKMILKKYGKNAEVFQKKRRPPLAAKGPPFKPNVVGASGAGAVRTGGMHRGAEHAANAGSGKFGASGGGAGRPGGQSRGAAGSGGKRPKKEEKLHPSWEAKKLASQKASSAVGLAQPKVHIKFDDDE